jgi:hypothetical protein
LALGSMNNHYCTQSDILLLLLVLTNVLIVSHFG